MKSQVVPKHLPRYRANLARYEAEGRAEQAAIQQRLIAQIEADAEKGKAK